MDYRYSDHQGSNRPATHDDQQPHNHQHSQQPQHLQHLPHFAHQHASLQPPSLPHQHMHHVGQQVFVAATHGIRDHAFSNRRHASQDMQSFLEVAGLVPVRPIGQQSQHPEQDTPHVAESRTPQQSVHQLSVPNAGTNPRDYTVTTLPASISLSEQQPQLQTQFHDYRPQQHSPTPQQQQQPQGSGRLAAIGPLQTGVQHNAAQSRKDNDNNNTGSNFSDATRTKNLDPDVARATNEDPGATKATNIPPGPPPPRVLVRDKWPLPGHLPPAPVPPRLPAGLVYSFAENDKKKVVGVKAERKLEKDFDLGVFEGSLVDEATGCVEESSWELCLHGKVVCYIDGKYRRNENWMLHVRCAQKRDEQNLEAFQAYGYVRFRTTKNIGPGSELKVFYSEEFANEVGFKTKLEDLDYKTEKESFQCTHCQCLYKSAKRMLRHIKLAHEQEHLGDVKPIFSWEVGKRSVSETKPTPIVNQNEEDNDENHFVCVTCGKDFPTKGRLTAHETFHEFAGGPLICDTCGTACENSQSLTKHIQAHHKSKLKCEICEKFFASKAGLKKHEQDFHGWDQDAFECTKCGKAFFGEDDFEEHKKKHVKKESKDDAKNTGKDITVNSEKPVERVKINNQESKEKVLVPAFPMDMLGKRTSYFDRPRPYKCRHCGLKFRQCNQRKYHEQEVHEGRGTYVCPHCSQRFVTRCNLEAHMKRHNPTRPFQCQLCPRMFASERALANHQGEHTGLKPYKCPVCERGFRTQKLMGKHRARMHAKREKRHPCSFCDKLFADRSSLRNHERRHKGIRPFVCLVCGKGFTSKDSMAVHQRVHTGEMPFKCTSCERSFRNNHNLTAHLLQHDKGVKGIE